MQVSGPSVRINPKDRGLCLTLKRTCFSCAAWEGQSESDKRHSWFHTSVFLGTLYFIWPPYVVTVGGEVGRGWGLTPPGMRLAGCGYCIAEDPKEDVTVASVQGIKMRWMRRGEIKDLCYLLSLEKSPWRNSSHTRQKKRMGLALLLTSCIGKYTLNRNKCIPFVYIFKRIQIPPSLYSKTIPG